MAANDHESNGGQIHRRHDSADTGPFELEQADVDLAPALSTFVGEAVRDDATDIHVDHVGDETAVRFRIDGEVRERYRLAAQEGRRLVNQIKVAADMEIDQLFAPGEGQFRWQGDRDATRDVRVTLIPTLHGETAHLRLLSPPELWRDIRALGMDNDHVETIEKTLDAMHGLVLICGRTGAGKTTTLYAMAQLIGMEDKIGISVEDPIEYDLPMMRQMEVDEQRGMTMGEALRVLLRADPDVLAVGEVRDHLSAVTATRAAVAGRLVLATLHGSDAAGALDAMHYLSVPYYVLAGALRLIVAQDLVRCLCTHCARSRPIHDHEKQRYEAAGITPPDKLFDPAGCAHCDQSGYHGRTGVFEVMPVDVELGNYLASGPHQQAVRGRFAELGMRPLAAHALEKASRGQTSMAEVYRVTSDREPTRSRAGEDLPAKA